MNTSNILAEITKILEKENIRIHTFVTKNDNNEIEFILKGEKDVTKDRGNSK